MSRSTKIRVAVLTAGIVSACAAQPASGPQAQQESHPILVSSNPAAGSIVDSGIDTLELHFSPVARLDEVAVIGPGGTMPMMVHAVGEVAHYSLPLSGVTPGAYTVKWRAASQGTEHRGSFSFTVR